MHLPGPLEIPLRLLLLIAGLVLPGTMVLRALRMPWSLAASFVISCAALYVAVLVMVWTGSPISLTSLAGALGAVALAGRLVPTRAPADPHASSFACFAGMKGWTPLYLAFWAIVIYRLCTQPLCGPDVSFRWSYLAEQMLRFQSLDFYPPRSGEDFVRYFWAESIPPGIATIYAWSYACGGSKLALWTSPVVLLQILSTHEIIWRLAARWGGEVVARRAVILASACPLLTWSFLIGQETGMTALSVAGLVWCLQNAPGRGGQRWSALAGIFGVVAASTREYGPVFAVAATVAAIALRLPKGHVFLLAVVALPLALAWPLRVWVLTGNPFYSLEVGGLFPTNRVFAAWSEIFHQPVAHTFSNPASWLALARYLVLWALPAVVGLISVLLLLARQVREIRALAFLVAIVTCLWFASVSHTAGGLFYSLRVLSPAYALLVVAGAYALGFVNQSAFAKGFVAVSIALMMVESLAKTLVLPENPYRLAPTDWLHAGTQFDQAAQATEKFWIARIQSLPGVAESGILTDIGGLPRALVQKGIDAIPLWSPSVEWLFDANRTPDEIGRLWQHSGLNYVAIAKACPTASFLTTHAYLRSPEMTVITVFESDGLLILQVAANADKQK